MSNILLGLGALVGVLRLFYAASILNERFGAHLFELDARLHDVSEMDAGAVSERARGSVEAARRAHEEDERARRAREKAEREGYPGRTFAKDAKGDGEKGAASTERDGGDEKASEEEEDGWASAWALAGDREGWLDENPLGVPTERECQTVDAGGRCYRVMLVRTETPV